MDYNISSIQQVGLGTNSALDTFNWYKRNLSYSSKVFDEKAEAALMIRYTGEKVHSRHAILGLNPNGGGGIEFWQFTSRKPHPSKKRILPGDLGIFSMSFKVRDIKKLVNQLKGSQIEIVSNAGLNPMDEKSVLVRDPEGNYVEFIEDSVDWYPNSKGNIGGIKGVQIGVSNIEASLPFYSDILGFNISSEIYEGECKDFNQIEGELKNYRRVVLTHSEKRTGPFAKLLGSNRLELIQVLDRKPNKIFEDRFWGDLGYIHLCFDVQGMDGLKEKCEFSGTPFTVDSAESFNMGKAAGRFAYTEDPDGTLIEFVETHKIPIFPKLGWYYRIGKKRMKKPLPDLFFKIMLKGS